MVFYVINDNTQVGGKVPQSDALHVMSQKVGLFYYTITECILIHFGFH
jgi:hypothetical protein